MRKSESASTVLARLNRKYRESIKRQEAIAAMLKELATIPKSKAAVFSDEHKTLLRVAKMHRERTEFQKWLSADWDVTPQEEKIAWESWKASARVTR